LAYYVLAEMSIRVKATRLTDYFILVVKRVAL